MFEATLQYHLQDILEQPFDLSWMPLSRSPLAAARTCRRKIDKLSAQSHPVARKKRASQHTTNTVKVSPANSSPEKASPSKASPKVSPSKQGPHAVAFDRSSANRLFLQQLEEDVVSKARERGQTLERRASNSKADDITITSSDGTTMSALERLQEELIAKARGKSDVQGVQAPNAGALAVKPILSSGKENPDPDAPNVQASKPGLLSMNSCPLLGKECLELQVPRTQISKQVSFAVKSDPSSGKKHSDCILSGQQSKPGAFAVKSNPLSGEDSLEKIECDAVLKARERAKSMSNLVTSSRSGRIVIKKNDLAKQEALAEDTQVARTRFDNHRSVENTKPMNQSRDQKQEDSSGASSDHLLPETSSDGDQEKPTGQNTAGGNSKTHDKNHHLTPNEKVAPSEPRAESRNLFLRVRNRSRPANQEVAPHPVKKFNKQSQGSDDSNKGKLFSLSGYNAIVRWAGKKPSRRDYKINQSGAVRNQTSLRVD